MGLGNMIDKEAAAKKNENRAERSISNLPPTEREVSLSRITTDRGHRNMQRKFD